ncbi:sirohydrochlorin chelatase [Longispora albida]|uniref:sirohydrochlorin chelatase n=1 Tax=Longispora albida TaxID=203523 RepID=UPI0009FF2D14|nr:CbiX/SirB N-terminal domain-containing protein [Longispora albida]
MLLAVAHGTRHPGGRAQIGALAERVRALRPGLGVSLAYVDIQEPRVATLRPEPGAVAVPLLLSTGYHLRNDMPHGLPVTAGLGPDPALADVLARRLAGVEAQDAVVLGWAGSSRPEARADLAGVAADLTARLPCRVVTSTTNASQAVAALRTGGARRVVIASYLLATGAFHEALLRAGADEVTEPLVTAASLAGLVLARYDAGQSRSRLSKAGPAASAGNTRAVAAWSGDTIA